MTNSPQRVSRASRETASATRTGRVGLLHTDAYPQLRAFLDRQPDSTIFHLPEWADVVRGTYGHDIRYWTVSDGDEIAGAFPVTILRAPGLGSKYIAMPYQMDSGVPLAADTAVRDALLEACIADAKRSGAKYIEIRHRGEADWLESAGFVRVESGLVTTTVPLTGLELTQAEHGHRQRVRKAGRLGVEVERTASIEDLRTFRRMYLETGRAMGAPQAGWRYFAAMHTHLGSRLGLYMAKREGGTVGGFLVLGEGRTLFARCSAHSSREALSANAGQALWWKSMTDAAEAGFEEFNCGISWVGDTGLIKWKEGWGGTSRPVYTYILPLRSKPPEAGGYFEGYGLAKAVWRRMPLALVDVIGHQVTRWIG
jgi:Acetyltransferase (GNAT) domain